MAKLNPTRIVIGEAIDLVRRHGLAVTPQNVRANVHVDGLTLADATDALQKQINAQIPLVLKEQGFVITDAATRERKPFWEAPVAELEEQLRIKTEGSRFDENRIRADRAVIALLKDKQSDYGYEVYPGLFHAEIDRIYAMHGLTSPGA